MAEMLEQSAGILIASIYPMRVGISRPFVPRGEFWIDPVEKGEPPKTILIGNQEQRGREPLSNMPHSTTIFAPDIAADFMKHAVEDTPGMRPGCHPGVWICKGPGPTREEEAYWRTVQAAWFTVNMEAGNTLALKPETVGIITPLMRLSAVYLGREPSWLNPPSDLDVTVCPYCKKQIPVDAVVCSFCANVTNFQRWAELEKQKKGAMEAALKSLAAA